MFANPIQAGQHKDSTREEIKDMKERSYILYRKLSRFLNRKESSVLQQYLPAKYEYAIYVPLTQVQEKL
jgi:SNF2 family DNA or RNA helicase